jgi:hypothetical protein
MPIRGTILVHHNAATRQLEVIAENLGDSPGMMTHNVFGSRQEAETSNVHDDMRYGHGDPVPHGNDARPGIVRRNFPINAPYNEHSVRVGNWFRVGFRGQAWLPVQIPPPGETVVVPYEQMRPSNGTFRPQAFDRASRVGGPLAAMFAALNQGNKHHTIGQVQLVPVPDPRRPNRLRGWEVVVENQAHFEPADGQTTGFSATVVLTNAEGKGAKNAGLGLESMGVPAGGYSARQFILFDGDYGAREFGVRAQPGTRVRLGVRGISTFDAHLPSLAEGTRTIGLHEFKRTEGDLVSAWFETKEILGKLGEKKGRVEFFKDRQRLNDQLPDTVYHGDEAFIRAEFKDPPRVRIETLPASEELPQGGWSISMESALPEEDKLGRVGFVGGLAPVAARNRPEIDEAALPVRQFSPEQRVHRWVLPAGARVGGAPAKAGTELAVVTGALGWRAKIALPKAGEAVDTHESPGKMERLWTLRETDYHRAKLYPPDLYRGDKAAAKAPVPAPELTVTSVGDGPDTPGGGWRIELASRMPAADARGALGFVGTLKLGRANKDAQVLPPRKFTGPDQVNTWFLPKGQQVGALVAQPGTELVVGGRGTGWYVAVKLPADGEALTPADLEDRWTFRADQFERERLDPAEVGKTRLGPDPAPRPAPAPADGGAPAPRARGGSQAGGVPPAAPDDAGAAGDAAPAGDGAAPA